MMIRMKDKIPAAGRGGNLSARNASQIAQMMPQNAMGGGANMQNFLQEISRMEKKERRNIN